MRGAVHNLNHLWSIILAGGEGERTRPFIERWLGYHKPKQYCTFVGTRSLLQHTIDRADCLVDPQRRVLVAADEHREDVWNQLAGRDCGRVVFQPENRGTAPGIYLPLTYVLMEDPEATVAIFPSDHFVFPEDAFVEEVAEAAWILARTPLTAILMGIAPDSAEPDYGWILPGVDADDDEVRPVRRFLEKPSHSEAMEAMAVGGLWNTLVIVAKAKSLWRLGRHCMPGLMQLFQYLAMTVDTSKELETRQFVYRTMPVRDFSKNVLEHVPEMLGVREMREILWSDWGKPARIGAALRQIGKEPAFPEEHVLASQLAGCGFHDEETRV